MTSNGNEILESPHLEAFEKLLYQFLQLHDLLARQQTLWQQQIEELDRCVAVLHERIQSSQYLAPIEKSASINLPETTEPLVAQVEKATRQVVGYTLEPVIQNLQRTSEQMECTLGKSSAFLHYRFWRELFIIIFCTVLVSLLVCYLFLPRPIESLDAEQVKFYQLGKRFDAFYQALPESERVHLWKRLEQAEQTHQLKSNK